MSVSSGDVVSRLVLDRSNFDTGLVSAISNLRKFQQDSESISNRNNVLGKSFNSVGNAMMGIGGALTAGVSVPLIAAGGIVTKFAMNFESGLAKVSTVADTTQVSMDQMKKSILDLSNQTGISADEISQNVYDAISAGQKTGDAVNFVTNSTKLAKAGFAEAGESLDLLTTIMNSYEMKAEDVTKVSDILINTQNLGKLTVKDMAQSMGKVIPTAKALGVNLEQVSTGYVLMTSKGIQTAEATTYMNSMLNELGKNGSQAFDSLKSASGKTFPQLISEGKSVGDVLNIMSDYAKKSGLSLTDLFGSAEAGRAALVLSNNAGKDFNATLSTMGNVAGATDTAFKKVSETTQSKFNKALNKAKNEAIKLGSVLLPLVTKAITWFTQLVEKFDSLSDSQQENIVKWGMLLVAMGPVMATVGALMKGFGMLTQTMNYAKVGMSALKLGTTTLGTGVATATSSVGLFGTALALLSNPITWVVAGITALGIAWYNNEKKIKKGTEEFKSMGEGIDDFSGKLRTNESIWTRLFGKEYNFKMSAQFHEQKVGVQKDSDEIVKITQDTKSKIEEILSSDLNTEQQQQAIKTAHEEEVKQLTEKWNQFNTVDNQNQLKNGQAYMQYLTDLGVTDYKFRSEQLATYNAYFDEQQATIKTNEDKILSIKQGAYNSNRQLTSEEETQINDLIKTNADIRTTLTEQEGKDVWQIIDKYNLEKKTLYGQDALNHTQADLDKRKSMQEYLKATGDSISQEIEMVRQRTDIDSKSKDQMIFNLEKQKGANDMFQRYYADTVQLLMENGATWEEASSQAMQGFTRQMENGTIPIGQFKMTAIEGYGAVIQKLLETGASADELTVAIKAIPPEKRAEVLATVDGKDKVQELEQAIARVQNKVITVTAYVQGTQKVEQMNYATGTDSALPGTKSVGEFGRELMVSRSGNVSMLDSGLANLNGGERIYTASETQKILGTLKDNNVPKNSNIDDIVDKLNQGFNALARKFEEIANKIEMPQYINTTLSVEGQVIARASAPFLETEQGNRQSLYERGINV